MASMNTLAEGSAMSVMVMLIDNYTQGIVCHMLVVDMLQIHHSCNMSVAKLEEEAVI